MQQVKRAVCALIRFGDDQILAVTRRDSDLVGFPGGKVDPGESDVDAVIREVYEEVGISLDPQHLVPIYGAIIFGQDGKHYFTTTFLYMGDYNTADIEEKEQGIIPVAVSMLDMVTKSAFNDYNKSAMVHCSLSIPRLI